MITDIHITQVYDALDCLVIRLDPPNRIGFINRYGLRWLGYTQSKEIVGNEIASIFVGDDESGNTLLALLGSGSLPPQDTLIETLLLHHDGSHLRVAWLINAPGNSIHEGTLMFGFNVAGVGTYREAATMFQTVSDNYPGSILITDPLQKILYANPATLLMSGYCLKEVIGKTPVLFKSGKTQEGVYRDLWKTINAGEIWKGEFINQRKDGVTYRESKTIAAIYDAKGREQYYLAIGEDLSQRQHYQQKIEHLLDFDQLTGLPNRATFLNALNIALNNADVEHYAATVLHIDIDDFFLVNKTMGVIAADQIIAQVAERLRETVRKADTLARIGNDKFAILIAPHEPGSNSEILDVAKRVLETIRRPIPAKSENLELSVSIGTATYPSDCSNGSELLSNAILATEHAKQEGSGNFFQFDPINTRNDTSRHQVIHDLHQAITEGSLQLYYQPQVSLFSGAIVGLEALLRWQHPQRGMLAPGEFIPLIEQSSLIVTLGEWVVGEACRQIRVWIDQGLSPIKIAINLAARHFLHPSLHTLIADELARYRVAPHLLEIEITEGAMMQDVAAAIRSTERLKARGLSLSLDDFGTGYSSLAYLSRFPIDTVKIDQSFVRDITHDPASAAIVQATIAMSHKLGKTVLAEGVETLEQMHYLHRSECDEMQGYFFSKPLPSHEVALLLESNKRLDVSGTHSPAEKFTVLFVDDEVNILTSLKRTLRREGYETLVASSATEGFKLLASHDIQVIVSDQRMPEMSGTEFLSRIKMLYPNTVRMVLSGYSEITAVTDAINKGAVYRFLLKPWDDKTIKDEISGALRHWRSLYAPSRNDDTTDLS